MLAAVFFALCIGPAAVAQVPMYNPESGKLSNDTIAAGALARLEYRQIPPALNSIVADLTRAYSPPPALDAEVKALTAEAAELNNQGSVGESRRRFARAITLVRGLPWTMTEEFALSLALRADDPVVDSASPLFVTLRQNYAVLYRPAKGLQLRLTLARAPTAVAVDVIGAAGATVKALGTFDVTERDLNDEPAHVAASLAEVPDGSYLLVGEVLDGEKTLTRVVAPISVVTGLAARRGEVESRLAKISGHEDAKATIRYPFALARDLKLGRREIISFDFSTEVARSLNLLASLESGKDLVYQAKGDTHRAYYFKEADAHVPFRIFVPSKWDGQTKLPMVVALHGSNLDENNFIIRANGLFTKLAEERGYILVAPLGFRINSRYGAGTSAVTNGPSGVIDQRRWQWSERDVLNVTNLMAAEYGVDRTRIYLTGNSMGGGGTWHIAMKHPEVWAAIAPAASGISDADDLLDNLRQLPAMSITGELDFARPGVVKTWDKLKARGIAVETIDIKGGIHGTSIEINAPHMFDFFAAHRRENTAQANSLR